MIAQHESSLKRTARRYSLDAEDAEDAYQRALEIALTKAPTTDARELIRWTHTVTKHEALAVRQGRERLLGPARRESPVTDPVALIPAAGDGPDEQVERREAVARSREALRALKPAELRALSLLAEGYSYTEIGELTGFSRTKVNRVLAEGRARFRSLVSSSEDGSRCRELQPLLSAFCDGEAGPRDAVAVREHLRACASCRSTMRAYRAAPRIASALAPALPVSRSLLDRLHDSIANLGSRLPGLGGGESAAQVAATGGSRGAGAAALAKLLTLCAGAAGGATACVATGVLPAPDLVPDRLQKPSIERIATPPAATAGGEIAQDEPAPAPTEQAEPERRPTPGEEPEDDAGTGPSEAVAPAAVYEPPPPPPPAPATVAPSSAESGGSAAGEFGP